MIQNLLLLTLIALAQDAPDSAAKLAEAQSLLPQYQGEHRYLLTEIDRARVQQAVDLLQGTTEAEGLRWRAHAEVLLGEDQLSRGDRGPGRESMLRAHADLSAALVQEPGDPWTWYARGLAYRRLGLTLRAIEDLEHCLLLTEGQPGFVRFKAQTWLVELYLDVLDLQSAQSRIAQHFQENGNDPWDRSMADLELLLRSRQFERAAEFLGTLAQRPDCDGQSVLHEQLGYVLGLLGKNREACESLERALAREQQPSVYPRIWLCIFSGLAEESRHELARFVEHPPRGMASWDLDLARFVLGNLSHDQFLAAADREKARRLESAEDIALFDGEVGFYEGWRYEFEGQRSLAATAYGRVLQSWPERFHWEWSFARQRFQALGQGRRVALPPMDRPPIVWHRFGAGESQAIGGPEQAEVGDLLLGSDWLGRSVNTVVGLR
ncbi:MAG: tetratricopeptide repeat protein [Planctomycetota bacterium]